MEGEPKSTTVTVTPIEVEYELGEFDERPVLERYYTKRYYCDPKGGDYQLLVHSNKVCILTLAPSHPIIKENLKIQEIHFQANEKLNRLDNRMSGKRKQGAQRLADSSILCNIICPNQPTFVVRSNMVAQLMEVNERLPECPELLKSSMESYIAIMLPIRSAFEREMNRWMTEEEYQKVLSDRQSN